MAKFSDLVGLLTATKLEIALPNRQKHMQNLLLWSHKSAKCRVANDAESNKLNRIFANKSNSGKRFVHLFITAVFLSNLFSVLTKFDSNSNPYSYANHKSIPIFPIQTLKLSLNFSYKKIYLFVVEMEKIVGRWGKTKTNFFEILYDTHLSRLHTDNQVGAKIKVRPDDSMF